MREKIKEKVLSYQDEMINSIIESIKIPSVISEEVNGCPFGENIDKALKHILKLCENLGFKTVYKDGYYGYAEVGSGNELIGILGHIDVVPEGDINEWKHNPYEGIVEDGNIYGRGTQDDKAPVISCIYAVKVLMDLNIDFNKRIRFIFGTDEENLWRCINKYVENNEEIPNYSFTPDSIFPMINAEKGLVQALLSTSGVEGFDFKLGNAFNSVPDKAFYNGEDLEKLKIELDKLNFEYEILEEGINVIGKAMHSQSADSAINAISRLCIALNNIGKTCDSIRFIADVIGEDANANNIIKTCEDDVSGKLTFNIGKLEIDNEKQVVSVDLRIPVTFDKDLVIGELIKKAKEYNLEYKEHDYLKAIYVPEDNFLIKSLRKVYEAETGLDSKPLSSGGATYARALENCVAFGPMFGDSKKTAHQTNEYICIEELMKATDIYALSIYELLKG